MRGSASRSTIHAIVAGRRRGVVMMGIGRRRRRSWEAAWAPIRTVGWQLRQLSIGDDGIAMIWGNRRGLRGIAGYPTLVGRGSSSSSRNSSGMRIEGRGIRTPGRGFVETMSDRRGSTSTSTGGSSRGRVVRGLERRWHAHGWRGMGGRRSGIGEGFGSILGHDIHFCLHK